MNHPNQIRRARGRLRTTQVPATLCGLGGGVRNWPLLGSGGIDPSALKGRAKAPSNATARHHPGGSFAFVMATGIVVIAVASQGLRSIGESLFAVNLVAFAGLATRREKPRLADGLDGTWLLVSVATEALAVLGTFVAGGFTRPEIVIYLCW